MESVIFNVEFKPFTLRNLIDQHDYIFMVGISVTCNNLVYRYALTYDAYEELFDNEIITYNNQKYMMAHLLFNYFILDPQLKINIDTILQGIKQYCHIIKFDDIKIEFPEYERSDLIK